MAARLYARGCGCAPVGFVALRKRDRRDQSRVQPTRVGAYLVRKSKPLARKIAKTLKAHGKQVAAKASRLYAERLVKDDRPKRNTVAAIVADLDSDDLGEAIEGQLAPAMLAAFRRAAAVGAQQVGLEMDDDVTNQVDTAAVDYAKKRGGELIEDLAGTTDDDLRALLARAVDEGMSTDELSDAVESMGAFGEGRADMIARTELAFAHVSGNKEGWAQSGVTVQKRSILGDLHDIEDECDDAADAGVVDLDDDFVDGLGDPPFHPNCCVGDTEVAAVGISAHFKRWYEGEVVTIVAGAQQLTVTPNHPVLTHHGWIAAGSLKLGDHVFHSYLPAHVVHAIDPDDCHMPTRFDEVADSFTMSRRVSATRMPTTAEAFHGDGVADGEVDVVWSDSTLADRLQLQTLAEHAVHESLCGRHGPWSLLAGESAAAQALQRSLESTRGGVGAASPGNTLAAGKPGVIGSAALGQRSNSEALALEQLAERRAVTVEALCEIYAGLAGRVESVQVIEVRQSHFAGHVYNLSTRDHWYFANGIVTHNCICDIEPVLPDEEDDSSDDGGDDAEKMVAMGSLLGAMHTAAAPRVQLAALLHKAAPDLHKTVDQAAHAAATSDLNLLRKPTEGQAKVGNYKKGRARVAGLPLTIENAAGSRRRPEWPPLSAHYGYVRGTEGADGDHVDVFVRPGTPDDWDGTVFVVDQTDADGSFDEHKCLIGYDDESTARHAYAANYPAGWSIGQVTALSCEALRKWLASGQTDRPIADAEMAAA